MEYLAFLNTPTHSRNTITHKLTHTKHTLHFVSLIIHLGGNLLEIDFMSPDRTRTSSLFMFLSNSCIHISTFEAPSGGLLERTSCRFLDTIGNFVGNEKIPGRLETLEFTGCIWILNTLML